MTPEQVRQGCIDIIDEVIAEGREWAVTRRQQSFVELLESQPVQSADVVLDWESLATYWLTLQPGEESDWRSEGF